MSKTPITDGATFSRYSSNGELLEEVTQASVARRLESDRAELIEVVRDFLEWNDENDWQTATKARALLARLEGK